MSERTEVLEYLRRYKASIMTAPERRSSDIIVRAGMIGAEKAMKIVIEAIQNSEHIKQNQ